MLDLVKNKLQFSSIGVFIGIVDSVFQKAVNFTQSQVVNKSLSRMLLSYPILIRSPITRPINLFIYGMFLLLAANPE